MESTPTNRSTDQELNLVPIMSFPPVVYNCVDGWFRQVQGPVLMDKYNLPVDCPAVEIAREKYFLEADK